MFQQAKEVSTSNTNGAPEKGLQRYISFIRIKVAIKRSGMSRSLFYKKLKIDPSMPTKVYLNGTFGKGPVGFLLQDYETWLMSLIEKSKSQKPGNNTKNEAEELGNSTKKSVVVAPLPAKIDNLKLKQLHDDNEITCKHSETGHDSYAAHNKVEAA